MDKLYEKGKGKISSISLAGYLRKMSPETFEIFEELFDDSEK